MHEQRGGKPLSLRRTSEQEVNDGLASWEQLGIVEAREFEDRNRHVQLVHGIEQDEVRRAQDRFPRQYWNEACHEPRR